MRALALVAVFCPAFALAQVPTKVGYQGRLLKADGAPETGIVKLAFALFAGESGGTPLWSEEQAVALTDGFYATFLGDSKPLTGSVLDGSERFLEVSVNGSALRPRQRVNSVPYALLATDARNLVGGAIDASSVKVAGRTVVDASGQVLAAAGKAFAESTALAAPGTINDTGNPVDWTKLKNVPPALVAGNSAAVAHDGSLSGEGTVAKPLQVVFGTSGTTAAAGNHTHLSASASASGFLSPSDWARFDGKLAAIVVTAPLAGTGSLAAPLKLAPASPTTDGFLASSDWTRFDGKLAAVAVTAPLAGSGSPGAPLKLAPASPTTDGFLASSDFSAFSGKLSSVKVNTPLTGAGTPASPVALAQATAAASGFLSASDFSAFSGKLSAVTATSPLTGSGTTGSPLALGAATSGTDGYLTAADWNAFNAKVGLSDSRLSDARQPLPGSDNYIQNGTAPQISASFSVAGAGAVGDRLTMGGATVTAKRPPPDLLLQLDFEHGNLAFDTTGQVLGTVTGSPVRVSGIDGGSAAGFSASADKILVAGPSGVKLPASWTIAAAFRAPLTPHGSWHTLTRSAVNDHHVIVPSTLDDLGMYDNAGGTGFRGVGFKMNQLPAGWHHLAAVGSGGTTTYYIDGQGVGTVPLQSKTDVYAVGNYQGGSQQWGELDAVRLYGRALASEEIQTLAYAVPRSQRTLGGKTLDQVECEARLGEWKGTLCEEFATVGCQGCQWSTALSSCPAGRHMCTMVELWSGGLVSFASQVRQKKISPTVGYLWSRGYDPMNSPSTAGNQLWYPWSQDTNRMACNPDAAPMLGFSSKVNGHTPNAAGAMGCYLKTYSAIGLCCVDGAF